MAEPKRYHIGINGPALCRAREKPCRYAELPHGEETEMILYWEKEQEEQNSDFLTGVSQNAEANNEHKQEVIQKLSSTKHYESANFMHSYTEEEVKVAMKVATEHLSTVGYTEVETEDSEWQTDGFSSVKRLKLKDGTRAYFKSISSNSRASESSFQYLGVSSLSAAVNEVNAYRLAESMGEEYRHLVPETSFTVYSGEIGSIQREVVETEGEVSPKLEDKSLRDDYRKAAIYDFISGNIDRHTGNFIYGEIDTEKHIALIDNSFAFPDHYNRVDIRDSVFADNRTVLNKAEEGYSEAYRIHDSDYDLDEKEVESLQRARESIKSWIEDSTIESYVGESALMRVDALLEKGKLMSISEWYRKEVL